MLGKGYARPEAVAEEVSLGHTSHWAAAALREVKERSHLQVGCHGFDKIKEELSHMQDHLFSRRQPVCLHTLPSRQREEPAPRPGIEPGSPA